MASADERNSRTIHTAACLIIGDEVLGGKVRLLRAASAKRMC
ncbi:molybdopterin binding domain-containing protein [Verticillium alfalfae VaMs.102]|uniref:Molybdopterin binding domain-containing protein n=1 Tax=Verticillium alfalfae (strain VaMs.102 / ATCC MYA-4576 / FGSC 10136) TaxID=526221 RepID=C9S910_VERA1|nr:molybdopterin binding domain-containing protein [Verticillium alfalfae VaMs.102]EEY14983.1 molybdopterin binding domain-containing protein [Verticillium alfalfae VaMs.102]